MLSRLSSYIFGGLFGAPDAETTPLRYETREAAGDWLLVDMPDQAIDDEDMDSDSEEDDILAAVPMLMSENDITEQPGIVLTYEEARDSSICDNYNKIQNSCYVDIQDNSDTKILNISDIQGESDYDMYNLNEFPWLFTDDRLQNSLVEIQENSNEKLDRNLYDKSQNTSVGVLEMSNDDILDSEKTEIIFPETEREFREDDMAIIKELTSMLTDDEEPQVSDDDETLESSVNSDNEVQENSDDFRYSSDDEFQDNSDSEENQIDSDDEIPEDRVQKYLELALIPRRRKIPLSDASRTRSRCVQIKYRRNATNVGPMKMLPSPYCARFHDVCCIKNPLYEHAADFQILPNTWDTNQTLHYPSKFSLAVAQCYSGTIEFASTTLAPLIAVLQAQIEKREASTFKPSSTLTDRNDHPEYLKRVFKLRDTALKIREAKNTALVLGQVKEIKPVQEAIQHESKKYLTRSHLNRQNKNYLYQSSVKTNRRRNLQRNHSGANNNRRC